MPIGYVSVGGVLGRGTWLIMRKALIKWKGREVKHTGDGFMVAFEDVDKVLAGYRTATFLP